MTHLIKERFFNQFCQRIRDMTEKLSSWKSVQHDDQQRALGGSAVASCQRTSKRWGPTRAQRLWCLNYPILAYHNQLTTLPHSRSRDNLRGGQSSSPRSAASSGLHLEFSRNFFSSKQGMTPTTISTTLSLSTRASFADAAPLRWPHSWPSWPRPRMALEKAQR